MRIPLTEPDDWLDWMKLYGPLARSEGLDAQVAVEPGVAVLMVSVSSDKSREETFQVLDAAVDLIDRAKAEASGQRDASLSVVQHVREW